MTKSEKTRAALLEAATELFLHHEYDSVKLSSVGKKAGVTHAALYEYFTDKEALFMESCEGLFARGRKFVDDRVDVKASARKRLEATLRANVELYHKHPGYLVPISSTLYLSVFNTKFKRVQLQVHEATVFRYEVILQHGNHEGAWKIPKPHLTARAIHSFMLGEAFKILVNPKDLSQEERAHYIIEQVNRWIIQSPRPALKSKDRSLSRSASSR